MVAAALGATVSVESLDGPNEVDIRPGSQSGQAIPLYGLGRQAPATAPAAATW